ncbi:AI-2E family transporter [Fonticella tunisiensis]|nr:AI-2E family transporter [Fonticella tunisiensis]
MKTGKAILKIIFIVVVVMILLKLCLIFLWPFMCAALFVVLLEPVVKFMKKMGFKRRGSVILSFTAIMLAALFILFYLISYIYYHLIFFFDRLPGIFKTFVENIQFLRERNINYDQIISTAQNILITYRNNIFNTLVSTIEGFVYGIIILFTTVFISVDLEKIDHIMIRILPYEIYLIIINVIKRISDVINVEIKLVFATTFQTIIGLYVLGIGDPLTIGLFCGILDILPVVGPGIIFIPWIAYELLANKIFAAIGLLFLYILLEINREIMQVKLMGRNLKIHPLAAIFSLYIGFIIYGVWGVILGPVILLLLQELILYYYEGRRVL